MSGGFAECVPACIVGVKVTSHIGRKTTAGDLFLTICDYGWKPLCAGQGLQGLGLWRASTETGLSGCGVGNVRRARAGCGIRACAMRLPATRVRTGSCSTIAALRRRFPGRSRAAPGPANPASARALRRNA
ncbi:hypothetical protein C7H84_00615 [Burkholderia sp. Nafp2/4-1b]|nr:hypothetical protein C7H84_00615 [Burkholderia sp. Nafp2/4-1b]